MDSKKLVRDTIKRSTTYDRIPYSFGVPPGFENNPDKELVQEVKALIHQIPKQPEGQSSTGLPVGIYVFIIFLLGGGVKETI